LVITRGIMLLLVDDEAMLALLSSCPPSKPVEQLVELADG
jgi:hypothetical protein